MEKSVILITGGTSGYGKADAKLFAEKGETVIITGRREDTLAAAAAEIGCDSFRADVTSVEDWQALYDYIEEKYGRLDLLVNNAGCGVKIVPVDEQTPEEIDRAISINLNGTIYGCRQFVPMMKRQGSGTIINIASVCAAHAWPGWSVYSAAKWGVLGFSKVLYTELRPLGIRVTCFVPAAGDTNFGVNAGLKIETPAMLKAEDVAQGIAGVYYLPRHVVIEEMTMWGIDQEIVPL